MFQKTVDKVYANIRKNIADLVAIENEQRARSRACSETIQRLAVEASECDLIADEAGDTAMTLLNVVGDGS